jgi:hypothetical protein
MGYALALLLTVAFLVIPGLFKATCIVEGGLVDTPTGPRPIQELQPGDEVWSRGPGSSYRIGRVSKVISARALRYLRIKLSDGRELCVTGVHPISTPQGWVLAENLEAGSSVEGREGPKSVISIGKRHSWVRVYDLEVEPNANFVVSGILVHNKSRNDRSAQISLKTIAAAQADFRAEDRDENNVTDYWVGDVAHLFTMKTKDRPEGIGLIERSIALADIAPLEPSALPNGLRLDGLPGSYEPGPKAAYYFATIPLQADGTPYDDGSHRHRTRYAFCAFPIYREAGPWTFIINEENIIYRKNVEKPARIPRWPADLKGEGWSKLD